MKRDWLNSCIITLVCLMAVIGSQKLLSGAGDSGDLLVGRIEFTGSSGKEGIIIISDLSKVYLLQKGTSLLATAGGVKIIVTVIDSEGKYARCTVSDKSGGSVLKGGEDVYYSDSFNSGVRYYDAKKILLRLISLQEEFIHKIESTEDPVLISKTVSRFSSELDMLIPEMKRINEKYPELSNLKVNTPAELKREAEILELLQPRLNDTFFKVSIYRRDERVKMALENLERTLGKMKKPAGN